MKQRAFATLATVSAVTVLAAGACTSSPDVSSSGDAIQVGRGHCGVGWDSPHGGDQTLQVKNTDSVTMEIELVDPRTKGVYAEVESLSPGTIRPIHLVLAKGTYAFACLPDDSDEEFGSTVTVTDGPDTGAAAVLPVDETALAPAVATYRTHVGAGLATLARDVGTLRTRLASGDRAASRAAWLVAQLDYGRLGAAYDTFGDSADAIDGTPDGLPGGQHDPDFTGLRRIEYGLWHDEAVTALVPVGAQLSSDIASLRADFGSERTDPNDLPLRSHEILENTLQFELTGSADQGAGDGLAIMSANLEGTRMVLDAIAPEIQPRYPAWATTLDQLTALQHLVAGFDHAGTWTPVEQLGTTDRERLDGKLGQLLENLAPIAAIGEVRRTQ